MKTNKTAPRKLLCILLALCMVLSLLPLSAFAVEPDISIDETNFPDEAFRTYVKENFDLDKNGTLSGAEVAAVTKIESKHPNTSTFKGIEYFTALNTLDIIGPELTTLDLTHNTALETLNFVSINLKELDLTQNTALKHLSISGTPDDCLENLDLSHNVALETLTLSFLRLPKIDISSNTALKSIDIFSCGSLKSLDTSKNVALESLDIGPGAGIKTLDLSNNTALKALSCDVSNVTGLDLSHNIALETLSCSFLKLNHLDLSHNTALKELYCGDNVLAYIDLTNNTALEKVRCLYNTYYLTQEEGFDYTTIPGNFDVSRVSNVIGGKFDTTTHTFSFDEGVKNATYDYDAGNGMKFNFEFAFSSRDPLAVTVENGKAFDVKHNEIAKATANTLVSIVANQAPEGQVFDKWVIVNGDIALKDENAETTTFTMPTTNVEVKAVYKDKPQEHTHSFGQWVVTKRPTSTKEGIETRTCICGEVETKSIPKLTNRFTDISSDAYYYEPVLWAVHNGITAGVSKNEFAPNRPCTRGQIVTFLWAAAGKPEPTIENPFNDVDTSDYYYKAVLWAAQNHITSGISENEFGPDDTCTRAQTVTFLWAAANKPIVGSSTSFTDVAKGEYYYNAVLWAVDNGITAGVGNNCFAPHETCTRGQIMTFMYKV